MAGAGTGKRVLLFSADPAHSLADCLKLPLGPKPTQAAPGLWAMEMNATADFAALKKQYRKELAQFLTQLMPNLDLTFDRDVMERLMDLSPPGIDELMALTQVMDFLTPEGYDILVLDAVYFARSTSFIPLKFEIVYFEALNILFIKPAYPFVLSSVKAIYLDFVSKDTIVKRRASAEYVLIISSGSITFPFDLLIFLPSESPTSELIATS